MLNIPKRILLVEDEPSLVIIVTDVLKSQGYLVESVTDGSRARDSIIAEVFDLLVLDVTLPWINGFDICRSVRQQGVLTPILLLTGQGDMANKLQELQIGADDYVVKPFDSNELLARVSALLRSRSRGNETPRWYEFGDVKVDLEKHRVFRAGKKLKLSDREFALLHYLIERQGKVISRDELLVQVWAYRTVPTTRTVDTHIWLLRRALERDPRNPEFIVTVHSQGYRFVG